MSLKHYGIFIAYPPTVDLRAEGLGRQLAAFLKAASSRDDLSIVVLCPSWSRQSLKELCESEGIDVTRFDIVSLRNTPVAFRLYNYYLAYKQRPRHRWLLQFSQFIYKSISIHFHWIERGIATTRSFLLLVLLCLYLLCWLILSLPIMLLITIKQIFDKMKGAIRSRILSAPKFANILNQLHLLLSAPKDRAFAVRLYRFMEERESELMLNLISHRLKHVRAWYSPTAFWPQFNRIPGPRLMCVPDVVLSEFPVSFSLIAENRFLESFNLIEKAIHGCSHFVTYSEHIKWSTLVNRYLVDPSSVYVIHHAPNDLSNWITINGFSDPISASNNYCAELLRGAMRKATNLTYAADFKNGRVRFLFYASQFRPSKNVLTLLRAYKHLLRNRFIPHKLILTGNPYALPEIGQFLEEHCLTNDVLCLHGLSLPELAACYHLAELAVNPSLAEGGCPFTFTEALSVGTPVVMARIPVTEEVITNSELQDIMLFDPYDWKDMATRIEWALHNREALLAQQKNVYNDLTQRTWRNVVDEYIDVLDKISNSTIQSIEPVK